MSMREVLFIYRTGFLYVLSPVSRPSPLRSTEAVARDDLIAIGNGGLAGVPPSSVVSSVALLLLGGDEVPQVCSSPWWCPLTFDVDDTNVGTWDPSRGDNTADIGWVRWLCSCSSWFIYHCWSRHFWKKEGGRTWNLYEKKPDCRIYSIYQYFYLLHICWKP